MAMLVKKGNPGNYSLSKKGVITFVFSKLAFLVFGIIIAASFFYVVTVQHNVQQLDETARTSDSIANMINMVSSSKFKVWILYESNKYSTITFENKSFTIHDKNELTRGLLSEINADASDQDVPISCLNISNTNGTVIKKCQ